MKYIGKKAAWENLSWCIADCVCGREHSWAHVESLLLLNCETHKRVPPRPHDAFPSFCGHISWWNTTGSWEKQQSLVLHVSRGCLAKALGSVNDFTRTLSCVGMVSSLCMSYMAMLCEGDSCHCYSNPSKYHICLVCQKPLRHRNGPSAPLSKEPPAKCINWCGSHLHLRNFFQSLP